MGAAWYRFNGRRGRAFLVGGVMASLNLVHHLEKVPDGAHGRELREWVGLVSSLMVQGWQPGALYMRQRTYRVATRAVGGRGFNFAGVPVEEYQE